MEASEAGTVRVEEEGPVRILTLSYPERRNALGRGVRDALVAALQEGMASDPTRVVVVTGEGTHFSSGGDISAMPRPSAEDGRALLLKLQEIVRLIVHGPKPVIAAVEGHAAGAGMSLAAACDVVVAARSARFACSFNRIGLVPDLGAAWSLPLRMGYGRARLAMLTGDGFDAETAERWGLVDVLAEPGAARADAVALATRMADDTGPLANRQAKSLLARAGASLDAIFEAEADAQFTLFSTADFAEGREAFMAKRKPAFQGR
jgi:enoyl-CoA hydratase/carnithine racemase